MGQDTASTLTLFALLLATAGLPVLFILGAIYVLLGAGCG